MTVRNDYWWSTEFTAEQIIADAARAGVHPRLHVLDLADGFGWPDEITDDCLAVVLRLTGSGTVRLAFLATLLLAVVPVSLVALFLASLAGGIAGVVA